MNAPIPRRWIDYAIGIFSLIAWINLFGAGLLMSSRPYRDNLLTSFNWLDFFLAACLYTYTNVALLTCLAGIIGGASSRLTFEAYQTNEDSPGETADRSKQLSSSSLAYRAESPVASMCRSFMVYLLYIAGLAIGVPGGKESLENTSPDQYLRMAGMLSLLGFAVGYDPTVFKSLWGIIPLPTNAKKTSN
jgi:hypothetical protein